MFDWSLIKRNFFNGLELWKTQTKFLVCHKYLGIFKFFNTEKEAINFFENEKNKEYY